MKIQIGGLVALVCLVTGCAHTVDYRTLHNQVQLVVKEGQSLIGQGKPEEGLKMLQTAKQLHPDDPTILEAENKVSPEQLEMLKVDPLLGFNRARLRAKIIPTTMRRVIFYIPDRIKDLLDMVTLDVNFGPQFGAGAWVTRGIQAVAYTGTEAGFGYHQKTLIGGRAESSFDIAAGPFGATAIAGGTAGIGGVATTVSTLVKHTPDHPLYQEYRDYWGIGAKIGLFFVGAEAEYHPIEIVDFLAGFILKDPLKDDLATSRMLDLSSDQKAMLRNLNLMTRNAGKRGLEEYKEKYPRVASE